MNKHIMQNLRKLVRILGTTAGAGRAARMSAKVDAHDANDTQVLDLEDKELIEGYKNLTKKLQSELTSALVEVQRLREVEKRLRLVIGNESMVNGDECAVIGDQCAVQNDGKVAV